MDCKMLKPISTQDKYNTQSKGNKVYWKEHCESIKYHKTENFLVLFIIYDGIHSNSDKSYSSQLDANCFHNNSRYHLIVFF